LKIEKNLTGDNNTFSVSAFIRDYMQLVDISSYKKATDTNHKELYRDFKDLFQDENHEQLIKKLAEYSHEYSILAGYKTSGNLKIDQKITDLRTLKISAFHSFILGVLHLRTVHKINADDCLAILDAIFVYVARKSILGIRKSENKDAALFSKYFDKLVIATNKRNAMLDICANQTFSMRLPNDNEIHDFLLSEKSNFYNFESGKFLFSLIEEGLTKNRPSLNDKILQVEHIMPQTLNETWKNELGENYKLIYDNYLNNIGNLTLIRHNQELSNHSFRGKKEIYENNAGMQITKNKIIDQQNWGVVQIKARAEYLVNILLEKILPISAELKTSNNYSSEKKSIGNRLSFESLDLIGKTIVYYDDSTIVADVIGNKEVKFEDKIWRLSPLTREIETRKNRRNRSGAYWGINMWMYDGRTLEEWMNENMNYEAEFEENEIE
jgi:hypothetical protein